MMFPSNRVRIMVATKPVDFRKGHDGLAALVSSVLRKDPFTGTVFVFRSRRADRLKLLYWDGTGLVMAYKRLEDTTFRRSDPNGRFVPHSRPSHPCPTTASPVPTALCERAGRGWLSAHATLPRHFYFVQPATD